MTEKADQKYHYLDYYLKLLKINDRGHIIKMLATIGLETILNAEYEWNVHSVRNCFELSNSLLSLQQHRQQFGNQRKRPQDGGKPRRFSRTDVLAHFPFIDEFGGVEEVFQETHERISALSLDEINLRHYIEKIFNEFKIGPKGMKSSDIPSALEILNLPSHSHPSASTWTGKKIIPFVQWDQIVRSIIESIRIDAHQTRNEDIQSRSRSNQRERSERKRPSSAPPRNFNKIDVVTQNQIQNQNQGQRQRQRQQQNQTHITNNSGRQFDEWKDDISLLDHQDDNAELDHNRNDYDDDYEIKNENNRQHSDNYGDHHNSQENQPSQRMLRHKRPSRNELNKRRINSHRTEILADKLHWKKTTSKEDHSALSSIASFRLRQYLDTPLTRRSQEGNKNQHQDHHPSFTEKKKSITPKDSKILSSGSSSLDIANAFLQSTLGQDLIQHSEHTSIGNDHEPSRDQNQQKGQGQGPGQGQGQGQSQQKRDDHEFYQSYYSQDWQSAKGGWVGDFSSNRTQQQNHQHQQHPLSVRNFNETTSRKKY